MKSLTELYSKLPTKIMLAGTTALAGVCFTPVVMAQDTAPQSTVEAADDDEVVVTGIRQALKDARNLKRSADTAVDSITASDVSTLPDLSVAEALSRIPGVVAQRFDLNDSNGGDFPSPEGGNNLIRGLAFVRSEFNGRESFSANGGRALDFGTVPPELIGSVNVYKNSTADLTEGGIGGTIDLRTLEPFDKNGRIATITADATYTDFREAVSPDFTVTLGDRWDGKRGEFGLLGAFSHSELDSRIDNFQIGQVLPIDDVEVNGVDTVLETPIAAPGGFQLRNNEVDRERQSYYVAGQWKNHADTFKATAKYFRIENDSERDERTAEYFTIGEQELDGGTELVGDFTTIPFTSSGLPLCSTGTAGFPNDSCTPTVPVSGLFESGVISNSFRDWTGARGARFQNTAIDRNESTTTDDISLNIEWRPADRWFVELDAHKTTSETDFSQVWGVNVFFSDFSFNPNNLDDPQITLVPDLENRPARRLADGTLFQFFGDLGDPVSSDFSDPSSTFVLAAADEFQENDGDSFAFRGDVEYEFDDDQWFDSIKFGARYSERSQTNRSTGFNWGSISPPWNGNFGLTHLPTSETNIGFEAVDFSDFFGGGIISGQSTLLFTPRELLEDYDSYINTIFTDRNIFRENGDVDVNGNVIVNGGDTNPLNGQGGLFSGNFNPSIINNAFRNLAPSTITEEVINLYGRLDFANEFSNGMSIDGNIGLRYARAETSGEGTVTFAEVNDTATATFNPETTAFLAQADQIVEGEFNSDEVWLPSFNAKLNLNDESLIRLAASKNITRPRIEQLNPTQNIFGSFDFIVDQEALLAGADDADATLDIVPLQINAFGGNPDLEPIESWNVDLGFEHYFGDDNLFAVTGFYKDISNNITQDVETIEFLNLDGENLPLLLTGDINEDSATFLGVEVSYQQFFDELPGIWSNLGIQANYTYIDADTNAPVAVIDADLDGQPDSDERIFRFGVDNFLGTSEHTANVVGIYQDDKFEFRLAYNFRSEFLVSRSDFVTGNPQFIDDQGIVDGSAKWDINDSLQLRLQVSNIFGSDTILNQQIDADGQTFRRAAVKSDRRIKVGFRYNF